MFEEIKEKQRKIIEWYGVENWVKDEIINVLDIQVSQMPVLDQKMYTILINSAEHPEGYRLELNAHPTMRIREGYIVRDSGGNPDSFFWDEAMYEKMKRKSIYYLIGTDTGKHLEAYAKLRAHIKSDEDGEQLSFKVASRKYPLEVMLTPAEDRVAVEVTEELLKELPELLESYNNDDPNAMVKLAVGDLLVRDGGKGSYYYRVEKSLKEKTYHKGI